MFLKVYVVPVKQGLHGRSAAAHLSLMGALMVVVPEPVIDVLLKLVERLVDAFPQSHLVELLKHGSVKPFADAVGLRAFHLGLGVVKVADRQEKLVGMLVVPPAVFAASVREDAFEPHVMALKER